MADKTVVVRLRAVVNEYNAAMGKAAVATDGVTKKSGDFSKLGAASSQLGGQLTRNVTLPMLAVGAAAGKMSYDFEATFGRMEGLAGVAADEVDGLKSSVLGLAGDTARAPQELAEGLYFIRSAGLSGKTALDALDISARGATAGLGSTAAVADAVTSAINAYGEANITAAEAGDVLAATAREGKAEASALAPQFGRLLPIAAELGVSFQEVGAGMAFLSRSSGDAALSATQLGGVLNKILEPGEEGAAALEAIGSSAEKLRKSVDENGLLSSLVELRKNLEANGMSLNDFSRDQQFLQGALQLTGTQAGQAAAVFDALENSTGSLGRAFDAVAKTDGFKMKQAMSEVQVALIQIGDVILPLAAQIAAFGAGAVAVFTALPGPVEKLALAFGAVMIATGPLLKVAGTLATNWKTLATAFDKAAIAAYDASANLGATAAKAGAVAVAIFAVSKAFEAYSDEVNRATDEGNSWADNFAGQFDPAKATSAELVAEINRLSGASDELQTSADNALNPFLDDRLKTARDNIDETNAPLIALLDTATQLQSSLGITADAALDLATDTDFMASATDNATGELDDEAAAHALVTKEITAQADALRAMFDPLFGAQDAALNLRDAQAKVTMALAANRDGIADNNVSQEEMNALNRDAVRAAVDYQGSLLDLKAAVADGSVSIEDSIATLQLWVDQGLITQTQADEASWAMGGLGGTVDNLDGKSAMVTAHANVQPALDQIDLLKQRLAAFGITAWGAYYLAPGTQGPVLPVPQGPIKGAEGGGLIGRGMKRPGPTDTIPMLGAPGEFMVQESAVRRLGVPALEALNAGRPMAAGGEARYLSTGESGGTTIVNHYVIHASSIAEHHLARTIRDSIQAGSRRGIRQPAA